MNIFIIVYWLGLVAEIIIRAPFQKSNKEGTKSDQRPSNTENILVGGLTVFLLVFPLIYSLTSWLKFADYILPAWLGWTGILLLAASLFIFFRAHQDLKTNWSPTLEIRTDHTLITNGIYSYIRHPMYASQWIGSFAQILLLQN